MEAGSLFDHFADLSDPRLLAKTSHCLRDIVAIAICAVISGADGWNEVADYGEAKLPWLKTFLDLPFGIPSHDTFRRVFALLDPDRFESCFAKWTGAVFGSQNHEAIAIDGKTLRRSFDRSNNKSPIHIVSAWATDKGVTLGQLKIDEKSNEITAIPALLDLISVKNSTVTIDAMGCQHEIAAKIIESEGDYILCLKGNQRSIYKEVEAYVESHIIGQKSPDNASFCDAFDETHGRLVRRRVWSINDIDFLANKESWSGLKSIIVTESIRGIKGAEGQIIGDVATQWRYFLCSSNLTAKQAAEIVRGHWAVENCLHWTLDVAFREDECRMRAGHSAENFSILRRIALNLLKQEKTSKRGIKGKRHKAGWDNDYLFTVLMSQF